MHIGLYAQHNGRRIQYSIIQKCSDAVVPAVTKELQVAQHEHDDEVSSIAIEKDGDVDREKLNKWLSKVLGEKGIDIFRMKGFLVYQNLVVTSFKVCICFLIQSQIGHGKIFHEEINLYLLAEILMKTKCVKGSRSV